jgi:iron-sulfur cluster repair protein YtfE (RIC family)
MFSTPHGTASVQATDMETDMKEGSSQQQAHTLTGGVDIYAGIHKAVRAYLCDTLARVARLDLDDEPAVSAAMLQVRELLEFCTDHIAHEDRFVHPAMEARRPGSTAGTAADHVHHAHTVAALLDACGTLETGTAAERHAAWQRLQRGLAQFTGDNLLHMDTEESANNAVLQSCYSDGELIALHQQILAALSPREMAVSMRWMLIGSSPAERVQLLAGVQADAPPQAFDAVLGLAQECLDSPAWNKLAAALAPLRMAA